MYPQYLYKFRKFEEKHLRLLTNNEIFFSSPTNFNDPFDGTIPLQYNSGSLKEIKKYWFNVFRKYYPEESDEELLKKVEIIVSQVKSKSSKLSNKISSFYINSMLNRSGIYCLSATQKNILLWSHYTDSHSGFAVGFNHSKLREFAVTFQRSTKQVVIHPNKVRYIKKYPNLNVYKIDENKRLHRQLFTKSSVWSYEKEYRLLLNNGSNQTVVIDDYVIDRVILGCKISDSARKIIIGILKQRKDKPKLFDSFKDETKFGLKFKLHQY